jgi:surface protein
MFYGCAAFRGIGLENWNTAKMNSMASFFYGALAFNRSITAWSLAACTDISNMFRNAAAYNQAMAWNTSNVAQMGGAFWGATAFAQNLSAWNTSKATTFAYTFASSSANFSISGWDLSALTTMANIWTSGVLSQANYNVLIMWCSYWNFTHGGTPINVPVGVGTTKYSAAVAAVRLNLIVDYGWSFVDGGQA